jgi:hypothetical protein
MSDFNQQSNIGEGLGEDKSPSGQPKLSIDELFSNFKSSPVQKISNILASLASHKTSFLLTASGVALFSAGSLWVAKEIGEGINTVALRVLSAKNDLAYDGGGTLQFIDLSNSIGFEEVHVGGIDFEDLVCPLDIRFEDGSRFGLGPVVNNFFYFNIVNQYDPNEVLNFNVGEAGLSDVQFKNNRIYGIENIQDNETDDLRSILHIFEGRDLVQTIINLSGYSNRYVVSDNGIILLESDRNVYRINPNTPEISINPLLSQEDIPAGTMHDLADMNLSLDGNYSMVSFAKGDQQGEPGKVVIFNEESLSENFDITGDFRSSHFLDDNTILLIGGEEINGTLEYGVHVYDLASGEKNLFIPATDFFGRNPLKFSIVEDNVLTIVTLNGLVLRYDLTIGREVSRAQIITSPERVSLVCLVES